MPKRSFSVRPLAAVVLWIAALAPGVRAQSTLPGADYFSRPLVLRVFGLPQLLPRAHASIFQPFVQPLFIADNWLGGSGNWSTTTSWSTGALPTSSNDVYINDSTPAAVVSLNVNATIDNLSIGSVANSTSRLSFNGGISLTIDGTTITNLNNTGPLGGITLNSSSLIIGSSAVSLTGGGIVELNGGTSNLIYGAASGDVLTNVNNTIQGSGNIGNNSMGLVNQGTIDANLTSASLKIQTSSGVTNTGVIEATNGADLYLVSDTYNNANGTILSSGTNSTVVLQNITIDGGTLSTNNGGVLYVSGNPTLNGVTLDGTYQLPNASTTTIEGTITLTSNGAIQMIGCCQTANLILGGAGVTLAGNGTVTMSNTGGAYIYGAAGTDVLTNASGSTIEGFGNIGYNPTTSAASMGLVNQGTIDANYSNSSDPLKIQTSSGVTNTGTLEATNGGNLELVGDTYNNATGTILASGTNSQVTLQNPTINGGTLSGIDGGEIVVSGSPTLNGVTIDGMYVLNNNNSTTIKGTIDNTGTIQMAGCCQNSNLILGGASVTLTGSGTVTLGNTGGAYIYGAAASDVLTNASTIQGFGNIGFNSSTASMGLINQGTIDANDSNQSDPLTVWTSNGTANTGTLEATAGGLLVLKNDTFNNAGGTIMASGASSDVELLNSTITGGTLSTSGGGMIYASGNPTLNGVANGGTYQISNTTSTTLEGTITNTGTIQMVGCCQASNLILGGASVTLTGGGTVSLGNTGGGVIYGASGNDVLTNVNNTIEGFGNIGNGAMGLTNGTAGIILANQSIELYIKPSSAGFTNNGTVQANTGSTLDITGGVFTNFNSATNTLTGGTYNANGGTLQFDNANIVTNAADIILTGAGSQIIGNTDANALANFATNAAGGVFQLGAGRSFTTSAPGGGNFTNNGTLIIGGGDTFQVSGALSNFAGTTLTGGAYYVVGTLQFGASGSSLITNDANLTLAGNGAELLDLGGNNLLTGFNTNASGGTFTVAAGGSYTAPGNFSNSGTMDVEQASSLTVGGNLTNSGTVATNLQNLQGGANTLAVTGTLTNNLGAIVTIGANNDTSDSAKVGLLSNAGTVTVGTGASLNLTSAGTDTNSGAISVNGGTLDMQAGSFTNSSTIDLEKGGTLDITGSITNSGTITTNNANQGGGANTVTVTGELVNGVGLNSSASMTIGANNDTADVANVGLLTNSGTVTVDKGATLNLTEAHAASSNFGAIAVNGGTLTMAGGADNSGSIDLEQKGTLTITNSFTNDGTLTTNNANLGGGPNTITITGTLFNDTGDSFTIGANNDTTDTASVGLLSNTGTVTVDKGATLKLTTAGADTSSGAIAVNGGTLSVQAGTLTNSGTLDEETGGKLTASGSLVNSGTITTNNANAGGAANSITVTGTLTNKATGTVTIGANNDTADTASVGLLSNAGTVTVDKGAALKLTATGADSNTGSISLDGGTMSVATGGAFTNSSTIDAENGGKLTVTGGFTNAGTLSTNGANLGGTANTITITGKLTNNAGATVTIGANNDTSDKATLGTLGNSGTVNVDTGASLTLSTAGTDTNAGTIAVSGTLDIKAATTLSGAGSLTLTNGAITGVGTGITLSNASTIQGSGTISNLGITNGTTGIISANQGSPLIILPTAAGLNNKGTLGVGAGDTMQIGTSAGGALTNFSGTTLTGGTYNVAGTLQFGASGTTIATNAAKITMSGAGQMLDFGNHNILAGFNNNAAAGSFTLAAGASLSTTGGTFTNSGLFTVSTGTTFTVGGSTFNFNQAAGTATVNGTLTSSTLGTLDVTGGSLFGSGTVGDNVVDGSVLSPGSSVAATGKLTVADTYTQQSAGALDIALDGATAGTKYDQLSVTKGATLGGTLNISLGTGFTPTVGETFTILTASTVSDTFATVNGLAINGSEHFTITYNAGSVVLKVVAGALPASNAGPSDTVAQLIHPALNHGAVVSHGSIGRGHYGLTVFGQMARMPTITLARVPATSVAPVAMPVSFGHPATGTLGFRPRDEFGSGASSAPAPGAGDANVAGAFGISQVSAAAYNSMSGMNHMRFECGVDLKALLKTSRKQLLKGLWAAPDSPDALSLGYMTFTGAH
jgi:hypothetical protein